MKKQLMAAALGAAVLAAYAQEPIDRILQLPFGKPLDRTIRECWNGNGKPPTDSDWCSLDKTFKPGVRNTVMQLMPPGGGGRYAVPAWVKIEITPVHIAPDGAIDQIVVPTSGVDTQDEIIRSVSIRFGKPTRDTAQLAQNAFGASAITRQVSWETLSASAFFMCARLDQCSVWFQTARRAAEMARSTPKRPVAP